MLCGSDLGTLGKLIMLEGERVISEQRSEVGKVGYGVECSGTGADPLMGAGIGFLCNRRKGECER